MHKVGTGAPLPRALSPEEQAAAQAREEFWKSTICQRCQAGCGLLLRVVEGWPVKVEGNPLHPINNGKICPKAQAGLQVLYDRDRIKAPMRHVGERGAGQWEPVPSDEAIGQLAGELAKLRQAGEPHTVAFLRGRVVGHI